MNKREAASRLRVLASEMRDAALEALTTTEVEAGMLRWAEDLDEIAEKLDPE